MKIVLFSFVILLLSLPVARHALRQRVVKGWRNGRGQEGNPPPDFDRSKGFPFYGVTLTYADFAHFQFGPAS